MDTTLYVWQTAFVRYNLALSGDTRYQAWSHKVLNDRAVYSHKQGSWTLGDGETAKSDFDS